MKRSPVTKSYGYDSLQPGQVLSSFHFCTPGASIYAKQAEILAAKVGTIWGEDCPLIFHKWQFPRHLSKLFPELRALIGSKYVFRVCVLDLQTISAMYTLGSWLVQSDEIRLYANDMQRSDAEYGTETRTEPTEATGIYFLCLYLMCWIWVRKIWLYKW